MPETHILNSSTRTASSSGWRDAIKTAPGVRQVRELQVYLENCWFDWRRRVDTAPEPRGRNSELSEDDLNFRYSPTRPKWVRRTLGHLPIACRSNYTFIDFGSGKGRILIMAAEMGFKRVYGIELRRPLHECACRNFTRVRNGDGPDLVSLNMDATGYVFPEDNLVLFFFNPFGAEVMAKVLQNLDASLDRRARDVWLVLHGSLCAHLADQDPRLRLQSAHPAYRIYRSVFSTVSRSKHARRFPN